MSSVIRCPNCGREIDSGSRFCEHCAARLCPGCHGVVPPRSKFCPHCGFAVGPALPGQEEPRPAPPPPRFQPPSAGYGGIMGPHPQQAPPPHSYSQVSPHSEPQPVMGIPIPRAVSPEEMAAEQPEVGVGMPRFAPARGGGGVRQFPRQPLMPEGPILARRFPTGVVVTVVVLALVGLLVFLGFNLGWFQGETWQKPLSAVQQFFGSVKLPSWLSFISRDATPPVISEVAVIDVTESGGTVLWVTDEPATSQVMICDPSGRCTWTELDETLVTEHSVVLSGLEPGLKYHLTITSTDAKGNQTLYEVDFTTRGAAVALTISGVSVSGVTESSVTITWSTNQPAKGQVEYGTTTAYGAVTPLSGETTSHRATLSGLSPDTTYHYRVRVQGKTGEEVTSDDKTFKTRSAVVGLETGTTVGKLALDFTLPDLEGRKVKLSQYRGKVVMVKFWVDSQSCRNELPVIQSFYEKWSDKGFVVLAVNWMQTPEQVKAFVQQKGLTFTVLLDQKGEVNDKYGVKPSVYAVTVLVDKSGVIRDRRDAAFKSELQIESLVKPLLQAK